jgi:hypothetical protein
MRRIKNGVVYQGKHGNHSITIKETLNSHELLVDGVLIDRTVGVFALPFVGGASLEGNVGDTRISAFVRNMGVCFQLELSIDGKRVLTESISGY